MRLSPTTHAEASFHSMFKNLINRPFAPWLPVALGCVLGFGSMHSASMGQEPFDFAHKVLPVLKKHCAECHTGDQKKGGLSLNSRESMLSGGESRAEVLSNDRSTSELLARVTTKDPDLRMPPEGPGLSELEIAAIEQWVLSLIHI